MSESARKSAEVPRIPCLAIEDWREGHADGDLELSLRAEEAWYAALFVVEPFGQCGHRGGATHPDPGDVNVKRGQIGEGGAGDAAKLFQMRYGHK